MADAAENLDVFVGGDPIDSGIEPIEDLDRGDNEPANDVPEVPDEVVAEEVVPEPEATAEEAEVDGEVEEVKDEVKDEEVKDDTPPELQPDHKIPKYRFDQVNERRKAAEAKAAQLEEQLNQAKGKDKDGSDFDFEAKEKAYMDAVLDGDTDKAFSIRQEIRTAEQVSFEAKIAEARNAAVQQTQAKTAFDDAVARNTAEFDVYNPDSEAYNDDVTQETMQLQQMFVQQGRSPADALDSAVQYVTARYGIEGASAKAEAKPTEGLGSQPSPTKTKVAKTQPPKMDVVGTTDKNESMNITDISEEEFDALPEATLRRLRGDIL